MIVQRWMLGAMLLAGACNAQTTQPTSDAANRKAEAREFFSKGVLAYSNKNYEKAIELYEQAMERGLRSPEGPYNKACCEALLGKSDAAFASLGQAIERGWRNIEHMKSDDDLKTLRNDLRWAKLLKSCEETAEQYFQSLKEPDLARELLRRRDEDQKMRREIEAQMARRRPGEPGIRLTDLPPGLNPEKVDIENTEFLKKTCEKHGWPGKSLVGEEAAAAAWLLAQHADRDPDFQVKCLELLKGAFAKGDASGIQLAYLTDRVLLKQGKKQIYGTQFFGTGRDAKPAPIEDETNVNKRRKDVGLDTLEEYTETIRSQRN